MCKCDECQHKDLNSDEYPCCDCEQASEDHDMFEESEDK